MIASRPGSLWLALAVAGGLTAQEEGAGRLQSPEHPLKALRSAFRSAKGKLRFVTVLSPT